MVVVVDLTSCWEWAHPAGGTPLGSLLTEYLHASHLKKRDRLVMVLTDDIPSDVSDFCCALLVLFCDIVTLDYVRGCGSCAGLCVVEG